MSLRRVAGVRVPAGEKVDPQLGMMETMNSGGVPGRMNFPPLSTTVYLFAPLRV
jgi:hypothetical protein